MLTFLAAFSAIVGAQTIDAPITAVTVFSDRARVTRTAALSLAGERRVELPLLPDSVDEDSIRVEASGGEVRRVDVARVAAEDFPRGEARALLEKIEQLDDQIVRAQEERGAAQAMIDALGRIAPQAPAGDPMRAPPKLNATGWAAAAAFVDAWSDKLRGRARDGEEKLSTLRREAARLGQEAQRIGGARRRAGLRVGVVLSGKGAARVSLVYTIGGARWYPTYDLQLLPDKGQVEVKFAGMVSQETGEDWVDAALTLSTAVPATSTVVPQLFTWKIGERERFIPRPRAVAEVLRPPPPSVPPPPRGDDDALLAGRLLARAQLATQTRLSGGVESTTEVNEPAPAEKSVEDKPVFQPPAGDTGGRSYQGRITGMAVDQATGRTLAGVTVTVSGPAMAAEQSEFTDTQGRYAITELPPGEYDVRFYYANVKVERRVRLGAGATLRVDGAIPTQQVRATTYRISERGGPAQADDNGSILGRLPGLAVGSTTPQAIAQVGIAPPPGYERPTYAPDLPVSLAGGYDLAFAGLRPETVRAGKGTRRVALRSELWPVAVERKVFPALAEDAYLVAELRSPSPTPLPGGSANLFVGADPAGVAQLKLVSPGEPFTLPLGIDRAIRPHRNVQLVTTEKGLISKDEITEYVVTTEIANPYRSALSLRVIDQYPIAGNKDVDIKLVRTEPAPSAHEPARGELVWRLSVPAGGKTIVRFVYTLKRPKGWRLH